MNFQVPQHFLTEERQASQEVLCCIQLPVGLNKSGPSTQFLSLAAKNNYVPVSYIRQIIK